MSSDLIRTAIDVFSDVVALKDGPASLVSGTLNSYLRKRDEKARDILIKKLADGDITHYDAVSKDDLIGVIYRYRIAASKNAQKENLELLSDIIAGRIKRNATIYPDEFDKYCVLIEDLLDEEIIILGMYVMHYMRDTEIDTVKRSHNAYQELKKSAIPSVCASESALKSWLSLSMRSGLIRVESAMIMGDGYTPTVFLLELARMVEFNKRTKKASDQN